MTAIVPPTCDGLCVMGPDVLPGSDPSLVAYPHPGCPLHYPGYDCDCGTPERCMSPTHGVISHASALRCRYSQNPGDPRATTDKNGSTPSGGPS